MGLGDKLLNSGYAEKHGPVSFVKWHKLYEHNPNIKPVKNGVGPPTAPEASSLYVSLRVDGKNKLFFNDDYSAPRGRVCFTEKELKTGRQAAKELGDFVVLNPRFKDRYSKNNKDWGWERWTELAKKLDTKIIELVQETNSPPRKSLPNLLTLAGNPRTSLAIMQHALCVITTEGFQHHAAAALNVPAVVIWGGFSSPKHLGYDDHVNLHDGDEPCGTIWKSCDHCRRKMAEITPGDVYEACQRVVVSRQGHRAEYQDGIPEREQEKRASTC